MQLFQKRFNKRHQNKYYAMAMLQLAILIVMLWMYPDLWLGLLILWAGGLIGLAMLPVIIEKGQPAKGTAKGITDTVDFAERTMPYFQEGLNSESAKKIVKIIREISNIPSVAMTDRQNVLAFVGEGCMYHPVGGPIRTQATLNALQDGKLHIIEDKADFNCKLKNCNCPLTSAIIVPLFKHEEVIGCLKFYYVQEGQIPEKNIRLAVGIGKLINMQVEMADSERQQQLATEAKLDALQAQVNPHFLFNALNTINMYINKEPQYARQLVVRLSTLLRYMLGNYGRFIPLSQEISYLEDYVMIENARYADRLSVTFHVDPHAENVEIPVFTIQPLVHNAIIHGILPKEKPGQVIVSIDLDEDELHVMVEDDGVGIREEDMPLVFESGRGTGCGIGVSNVDERLRILYGEEYGLKIKSQYMKGTAASFRIPIKEGGMRDEFASIDR